MPTTTQPGLSVEKLQEISQLVRRAGDEAVQLRIVERFLSEVERRLLKTSPQVFDIERLRTALQILKSLTPEDDIDECLEAEFRLDQEFHLWRELIVQRDQKIETYHFRRLCDSAPFPLDDDVFVALAAFYRSLDLTSATQSKFDLSVTRLFTQQADMGRRELRSLRSDNVKRLKQMFGSRVSVESGSVVSRDAIESAVSAIDSFIDEALSLADFEDLVRANIFDRYRAFKRDLDTMFFEPEIIAAAIECNVVVGNVFNNLLQAADDQLSSRLTVDVDLAAALHDPSPESRTHINELFRVFFSETEQSDEAVSSDIDYLGKLLAKSGSGNNSKPNKTRSQVTGSAQDRITPVLKELSQARPDSGSLLKLMQRSDILKGVDLHDFLYTADGDADMLCRRAFGLILWSIEFRESELALGGDATDSTRHQATSLLSKAENLATKLRNEIEVSDELNESRLRAVLNALLDSRLQLERAIVRFTSEVNPVADIDGPKMRNEQPTQAPKNAASGTLLNKVLQVLAFLIGAAGGYYLYTQGFFSELFNLLTRN
jgi:hypothetical protein